MKRSLLFLVFLFFACLVHADTVTHGMTIPDAHPRLWWNAARLATAQAYYVAHPFSPAGYTEFHNPTLETAWIHVVHGDSCASAIITAMTDTSASGCIPSGNGCDAARWNGEFDYLVYDWCFDELTTQQRSDFLNNLNSTGKGWNDYLAAINQQVYGGPAMAQNNYNWGNLRNNVEYAIATYAENTTVAETLLDNGINTRWNQYFVPAALIPKLVGGVPSEGDAYGTSIPTYALMPFQSTDLLGRDILAESGYFKQFIYYVIYATTPAPTPTAYYIQPFGDDEQYVDGGMLQIRNAYQDIMNFFSNYYSNINVGKDARQWVNTVAADANTMAMSPIILAQDANPAARATSNLPLDYYATGIQYLYGRKAWDSTSAYFFIQMSNGQSDHSHYDFGNFHIWRGGRWLTRETVGYSNTITGYGYRSWASDGTSSALSHNMLLFGTPLYADSGLMPSVKRGDAVVNRLESATGYSYADVDLTNLYLWDYDHSSNDHGVVVHVEREFLFLRNLETTVVFDRITTGLVTGGMDAGVTAANEVNTFLLHSETNPSLDDANHITITNGTQVLHVTTLVPATPDAVRSINEQSCIGCSAGIGQYRIEIDTHGAAQRYFLHVLQARTNTDANLTASVVDSNAGDPTSGTFTVTLHPATGSDTTVVFNKGQTSSGGSVNLAGAGVTNLRSDVQGITYTDNGPVWDGQSTPSTGVVASFKGWNGGGYYK